MNKLARGALAALLLPLLAACDDDGTGPDRIEATDVAGAYAVCQLVFQPAGGLASVDIAAVAFAAPSSLTVPPALRVNTDGRAELAFTPRGESVSESLRGTVEPGTTSVVLRLTDANSTVSRSALLLPDRLTLQFQESPRALTTGTTAAYAVPRADYVRLSGSDGTNLAPQIQGTLSGVFRAGGCG